MIPGLEYPLNPPSNPPVILGGFKFWGFWELYLVAMDIRWKNPETPTAPTSWAVPCCGWTTAGRQSPLAVAFDEESTAQKGGRFRGSFGRAPDGSVQEFTLNTRHEQALLIEQARFY